MWQTALILDLRYVIMNNHVYKQTIKFEDWRTARIAVFRKWSFFTKFDLKSGYHHLDIFSEHQPYLGFSWKMNGETPSYFMFTAHAIWADHSSLYIHKTVTAHS